MIDQLARLRFVRFDDEADAKIVASNDLDEKIIKSLKDQGAAISVWGVGTKLVTAYDQPALGGVYKLSAIRDAKGNWSYKLKLSSDPIKVSNPGIHQARRGAGKDTIYDVELGCDEEGEDLLVPVFRSGQKVYGPPSASAARARAAEQLSLLDPAVRRHHDPAIYPVALEARLAARKQELIREAGG